MPDTSRIEPNDLGIKLSNDSGKEHFKWLLACQLFGARISQEIAAKTFKVLDKHDLTSPKKLADANWQELVDILDKGGYTRYDESTAQELISIGKYMEEEYDGSFRNFLDEAKDTHDLEQKVQEFKGVGPKAAEIFVREAKL